jgi:hypothetical protein
MAESRFERRHMQSIDNNMELPRKHPMSGDSDTMSMPLLSSRNLQKQSQKKKKFSSKRNLSVFR